MISIEQFGGLLRFFLVEDPNPHSSQHQAAKNTIMSAINEASAEELQKPYAGTVLYFVGTSYAFFAANACQWQIFTALARKNAINPTIMNQLVQMPGRHSISLTLAYLCSRDKVGRKIMIQDNYKLAKLINATTLNSLTPNAYTTPEPMTPFAIHLLDKSYASPPRFVTQTVEGGINGESFVESPDQEDPEWDGIRLLIALARNNTFLTNKTLRYIINANDEHKDKLLTPDGLILLLLTQRAGLQFSAKDLTPTFAINLLSKVYESHVAKKLFTEGEFRLLKVIDPLWLQSDAVAVKAYRELQREMWAAEVQEYEILPTIPTVTRRAIINSFHLFTESLPAAEKADITSFWNRLANRAC